MAGADAQLQQRGHVRGFRQRKAVFHHVHHVRQVWARVQQTQGAFECKCMGAFLDDGCTFAIVFAHHNERTAQHAGRGQVGQGIRGHIGADNRFPGDRAAQGVVDARAQHGRGRSFVGTCLDMHTQFLHQGLGLHHHVQQMRHRCALVAAHIGDARLQQGLGDRQDALAMKRVAVAKPQGLDFINKGNFQTTLRVGAGMGDAEAAIIKSRTRGCMVDCPHDFHTTTRTSTHFFGARRGLWLQDRARRAARHLGRHAQLPHAATTHGGH